MKTFKILLMFFFAVSCNKKSEKNDQPKRIIQEQTDTTLVNKDLVNYFFQANGGSVLYLKNGEMKSCARCDFDNDFIGELLKTQSYYGYKDYENYIIENNSSDTLFFFNELTGKISPDWKILKQIPVNNESLVISFSSPNKPNKETEEVRDTRLAIFKPETKTFEDENSSEADAYFTAMDDWNWYSHELNEYFEKLKIKTVYLKNRYVSFPIEQNKEITIDTQNKINNSHVQALLYKKGKRPIIISLIPDDNEKDMILDYLK